VNACVLVIFLFLALLVPRVAESRVERAIGKVTEFLIWERSVRPLGVYHSYLVGDLPGILSVELICLLREAAALRAASLRDSPGEKPPFAEGSVFLPNAWDPLARAEVVAANVSELVPFSIEVSVLFVFGPDVGAQHRYISKFVVGDVEAEARIVDIRAGATCDFCQYGSLRLSLYETLASYSWTFSRACGVEH
jgi:hypothetical protein